MLPQLVEWLPKGVKIATIQDRTLTIRASVDDMRFTFVISVALVLMVVALFMRRLAPTVIAAVTVPLALAGAAVVMYLLGYTLNNLSLLALVIATAAGTAAAASAPSRNATAASPRTSAATNASSS